MKPGIVAGLIVAALIAVGVFVFVSSEEDEPETTVESTQQTDTSPTTEATTPSNESEAAEESSVQTITAEEVAVHNSESDCWTIVDGNVYDITSYIPRHPGGNTILEACGTDGTSLFNQRTTQEGQEIGSGTPHSSNAASQLASLQIGVLDSAQ